MAVADVAADGATTDVLALCDGALGERVVPLLEDADSIRLRGAHSTAGAIETLPDTEADLVISAGYRHIIPEAVIKATEARLINAHISYLPWGRGADPHVWAIVDGEPAGVTLHEMTAAVDEGPIIDQRRVPTSFGDTAETLYHRLLDSMVALLEARLEDLCTGDYGTTRQSETGSYHRRADFEALCELDPDREMTVRAVLDRLRALSFGGYDNAVIEVGGEEYHVDIEVTSA
jgi:methionyl-tRNA formyltransferase